MKKTILGLCLGLATLVSVHANAVVGQPAPDFTLNGVNGEIIKLSEHKGKTIVLEWTNYDCPFVVKFYSAGAMQALQTEFSKKGVAWLSICSSASGKQGHFSVEEIKSRMEKQQASPTAYLIDEKGEVGRAYGAKTTPHMYIINPEGVLVYNGAIDSMRSTDSADIAKATPLFRNALEAVLANKPVENATNAPYGCSVKY